MIIGNMKVFRLKKLMKLGKFKFKKGTIGILRKVNGVIDPVVSFEKNKWQLFQWILIEPHAEILFENIGMQLDITNLYDHIDVI